MFLMLWSNSLSLFTQISFPMILLVITFKVFIWSCEHYLVYDEKYQNLLWHQEYNISVTRNQIHSNTHSLSAILIVINLWQYCNLIMINTLQLLIVCSSCSTNVPEWEEKNKSAKITQLGIINSSKPTISKWHCHIITNTSFTKRSIDNNSEHLDN